MADGCYSDLINSACSVGPLNETGGVFVCWTRTNSVGGAYSVKIAQVSPYGAVGAEKELLPETDAPVLYPDDTAHVRCGETFSGVAVAWDFFNNNRLAREAYTVALDNNLNSTWVADVKIPEAGYVDAVSSDDSLGSLVAFRPFGLAVINLSIANNSMNIDPEDDNWGSPETQQLSEGGYNGNELCQEIMSETSSGTSVPSDLEVAGFRAVFGYNVAEGWGDRLYWRVETRGLYDYVPTDAPVVRESTCVLTPGTYSGAEMAVMLTEKMNQIEDAYDATRRLYFTWTWVAVGSDGLGKFHLAARAWNLYGGVVSRFSMGDGIGGFDGGDVSDTLFQLGFDVAGTWDEDDHLVLEGYSQVGGAQFETTHNTAADRFLMGCAASGQYFVNTTSGTGFTLAETMGYSELPESPNTSWGGGSASGIRDLYYLCSDHAVELDSATAVPESPRINRYSNFGELIFSASAAASADPANILPSGPITLNSDGGSGGLMAWPVASTPGEVLIQHVSSSGEALWGIDGEEVAGVPLAAGGGPTKDVNISNQLGFESSGEAYPAGYTIIDGGTPGSSW